MYKETTDFIGKDPMQWWIGQVTDPKKGKWDNLLEKKNAENGEPIYSHRCRVRIVGYHGCGDELPDDELPLAHVLLPPNMSTTGGLGSSMKYHGGEVVVGFFLDGDNAQIPVIFGLYGRTKSVSQDAPSLGFAPFTGYTERVKTNKNIKSY